MRDIVLLVIVVGALPFPIARLSIGVLVHGLGNESPWIVCAGYTQQSRVHSFRSQAQLKV